MSVQSQQVVYVCDGCGKTAYYSENTRSTGWFRINAWHDIEPWGPDNGRLFNAAACSIECLAKVAQLMPEVIA